GYRLHLLIGLGCVEVDHGGRLPYACHRGLHAALYPFRLQAKTMADHTPKRSLTTKPVTIQPPPGRAMKGMARPGSLRTRAAISIRPAHRVGSGSPDKTQRAKFPMACLSWIALNLTQIACNPLCNFCPHLFGRLFQFFGSMAT
ncbi:MAG: hypothetical protein WCS20_10250, partial [Alphaproteobacteria bacterium]